MEQRLGANAQGEADLSPEQRAQAERIYAAAQTRAIWAIGGGLAALSISGALLGRVLLGVNVSPSPFVGGGIVVAWFLMPLYATRMVRRAGLSLDRVERQACSRTASVFVGEPLLERRVAYARDGLWGIVMSAAVGALWAWLSASGHGGALGMRVGAPLTLMAFGAQALYRCTNPPFLRLDERGVFNGAQHFWPQRLAWSRLASAELQCFFNYKGQQTNRRLVFKDARGKARVSVWLLPAHFSDVQVEELMAQIEARLRGDKISPA